MAFSLRRFHNGDCSAPQLNLNNFPSSAREGSTRDGWEGSRDDSDVPQEQRWFDQGGGDYFFHLAFMMGMESLKYIK